MVDGEGHSGALGSDVFIEEFCCVSGIEVMDKELAGVSVFEVLGRAAAAGVSGIDMLVEELPGVSIKVELCEECGGVSGMDVAGDGCAGVSDLSSLGQCCAITSSSTSVLASLL